MADESRLNELLDLVEQARAEGDSATEQKAVAAYRAATAPKAKPTGILDRMDAALFGREHPAGQTEGQKWKDAYLNVSSAISRPLAKAAAGLPLLAADAGVSARNLIQGAMSGREKQLSDLVVDRSKGDFKPYELPSSMFNRALDSVTLPPETTGGRVAEGLSSMVAGMALPGPSAIGVSKLDSVPKNFNAGAYRQELLRQAQENGYVAPPSSANPSIGNRLLEGLSGKLKLNQEAAIRNQQVTDQLSAQAIGETSGAPLTQGALSMIRKSAADAGYGPVRKAGEIATDEKYLSALDEITSVTRGAGRSFPGIKPDDDLAQVIETLKQSKFDAGDGIDAISFLRKKADTAYGAGNKDLGSAYKAASKAVEDMVERGLASKGEDGAKMLSAFREARKLMAKTYTAGKALVGDSGSFNARSYAADLARGKPLEGEQKLMAQFATNFSKYATKPTGENFPAVSPLDVYGSAIAAGASGSPAPFLYPLSRVALRNYLLSPAGQQKAMQKPFELSPFMGLPGIFGPANQSLNQP